MEHWLTSSIIFATYRDHRDPITPSPFIFQKIFFESWFFLVFSIFWISWAANKWIKSIPVNMIMHESVSYRFNLERKKELKNIFSWMEDEFQYKGVKQDRSSSPSFSLDHGDETPQPWNRPFIIPSKENKTHF